MKAIDTNVLVYAEVVTSKHHVAARTLLADLAEGPIPWALPWPCIYEFLRVVTHPRVFHPPVPSGIARADLAAILASPTVRVLAETPRHQEVLDAVLAESGVTGNLIHDAHIVALCRDHGVSEILTADRDFLRFRGIKTTDPFTA